MVYTRRLKKVRRIYNAYNSSCIGNTTLKQVSYESLIKDILFEWKSTASDTLLGRTEDMFEMAPVSLETHFCSTQRGLRCSAAHGRRQAAHRRLYCILDVFKASWIALVHLGLQVTPQEKVQRSQVRGAGRPRTRLKPGHHVLSEVAPAGNPGFLGRCEQGNHPAGTIRT